MPCACDRCREHARVLGLDRQPLTRPVLRKAFLAAARRWHPDRFEQDLAQRAEAEERFKQVQAAYSELGAHLKRPERPTPGFATGPSPETTATPSAAPKQPDLPHIYFGNIPGCYAGPRFPARVRDVIATHLEDTERAHAFLDLSATASRAGDLSTYLLLTSYRIFYRNALGIVSLLWYVDLGENSLREPVVEGKPGLRQRIRARFAPPQRTLRLEIRRHNGAAFCTLAHEADDTVKKVVYNFLRHMKPSSAE
ncbi:MAG TPA: J domain-containing protein [Terracidiphilus sp.]|nr:J domain-containing protein [Terracidiphilus sp.]